jgi:hypothetical protein
MESKKSELVPTCMSEPSRKRARSSGPEEEGKGEEAKFDNDLYTIWRESTSVLTIARGIKGVARYVLDHALSESERSTITKDQVCKAITAYMKLSHASFCSVMETHCDLDLSRSRHSPQLDLHIEHIDLDLGGQYVRFSTHKEEFVGFDYEEELTP